MKLEYDNDIYNIELNEAKTNTSVIINEESSFDIKYELVSDNDIIIYKDNNRIKGYFSQDKKHIRVNIGSSYFLFNKIDEESYEAAIENSDDREELKAPMPGSIVKVIAKEGDKVEEASPILIVEAMKMESTLYASISGVVTMMNAKEGTQIDSDDILAIIEKESE